MLFSLKKQLCLFENNLLFKIFMRVSLFTVKYFLNMIIFVIAAKKFNHESDESWKRTLLFLENFFQSNSSISIRLINNPLKVNSKNNSTKMICYNEKKDMTTSLNETSTTLDSSSSCDQSTCCENYRIKPNNSNFAKNFNTTSTLAQFKMQPFNCKCKHSRNRLLIKRLRSYYKTNLFKIDLNDSRNSTDAKSTGFSSLQSNNNNKLAHNAGLPDLINQKVAKNSSKESLNKSIDDIKFDQVQVPESLVKQLEFFDRDELIQLIAFQKKYLDHKESRIRDLENYIDNLVVKIIEIEPSILMNVSNVLAKNIRI